MAITKTLGGKRLGDGGGMKVDLHEWGKSTHDLGGSLKTSMGIGVLYPFYNQVVLPGDEWKVKLYADLISKPTNGPLFGKFKFQADMFFCPYRLYIGGLHNNKLGVALAMQTMKLPQIELKAGILDYSQPLDNQQISSSALPAFLGIRGIGRPTGGAQQIVRRFNASDIIAYYDIGKNYYINTQEQLCYVIHRGPTGTFRNASSVQIKLQSESIATIPQGNTNPSTFSKIVTKTPTLNLEYVQANIASGNGQTWDNIVFIVLPFGESTPKRVLARDIFATEVTDPTYIRMTSFNALGVVSISIGILGWDYASSSEMDTEPRLQSVPIVNFDTARERILTQANNTADFIINENRFGANSQGALTPYSYLCRNDSAGGTIITSLKNNQQNLLVKTYQADIFNAWVRTDYINQITTASTIAITNNQITIDQINLAKKVWEHLNRLVASNGTYRDFIEVAYGVRNLKDFEIPIYLGGLSKQVVFQEIVSNADTAERPLASIAGKGTFGGETKGGYLELEADEAGILMGIASLTPYIDYTQGNFWAADLKTIDDLHKPAFDQIGYQDNNTDQFAWFDTGIDSSGNITRKSAGKVPAWLNYQTYYNRALGSLADDEMWLILGRRYEHNTSGITDLTTYIDPKKFNYIWADARRDAMNFWVEITVDATARRVMSANQIPKF